MRKGKSSVENHKSVSLEETQSTQILNIRLPDDLILELDNLVDRKIFKSRSEAIREFAREYVQEHDNAKVSEPERGRW